VQLTVWPEAQADVPAAQTYDPTEPAFVGLLVTAFDPSTGFPWTVGDPQQDASLQPVWTDGQNGSPAYVPPELSAIWNLDTQQDRPTGPTWYDPTEQSYAIGPTLTVAQLVWQGLDPQQDRSLQPVWYDPEFGNVWTAALAFGVTQVTAVFGPTGLVAAPSPLGSAIASSPTASASSDGPDGEASASAPSGTASAPTPR